MPETIKGRTVEGHYLAVFNAQQQLLGDALRLIPPARIDLQLVGDKMGFQLHMPREIIIPLNRPDIVGFGFLDDQGEFLVGFSIAGNPEGRTGTEEYVIKSRYIIMAPRRQPS
jgi:hypothetical protein